MADESPPCIIAIVGAGIAGPVLALSILSNPLLRQLYKPVIFDHLPNPRLISSSTPLADEIGNGSNLIDLDTKAIYAAGAAVGLTSNALYPLYSLGLQSPLKAISCETTRIKIWRAWGGKDGPKHKFVNQINKPNWQKDLGTSMRVVERGDLQQLVLEKVEELGGTIVWGKRMIGIQTTEEGGVKLCFEGGEEVMAGLAVGADGGWSALRRHIISSKTGNDEDDMTGKVDDRWKPEFAGADGIYGVSKPMKPSENGGNGTGDDEGEGVKEGDTHWVLFDSGVASTWALPGGRKFWTISFPSDTPPKRKLNIDGKQQQKLGRLYGADVALGGHKLEETEEVLKKYENAWHPAVGTFKELFQRSERIVRSPLWYHAWEKHEIGMRNVVLIGDASRLMLPSSGQGACFAIEDATILANELLNNPPVFNNGTLDFSEAIEAYTQARVPRSKSMTRQSYWTAVIGLANRWWWRWLRDISMSLLPAGSDSTKNEEKKAKDPMGWLYEVRYEIKLREEEQNLSV